MYVEFHVAFVYEFSYAFYKTQYHPDKLAGSATSEAERTAATEQFQKISKAYETLSNAELRHQFDTAAKGPTTSVHNAACMLLR